MAAFNARQAAEEHAARHGAEVFEFIGMDGKTYVLPPVSTVTTGQAKRLLAGDLSILNEIASPEACAALDDLPIGVFEDLGNAWYESAEEAGKSGSASPSTRNSGTRSTRTSRSAARN